MARAGITKHQVENAYKALITQGTHPSIDSLRIELGNTGSKTTISRYLKELEAEQCVQMEDEALLSVGIKDLIAKLASKLHLEANDIVQRSKNGYQDRIKALKQDNIQLKQALEAEKLELEKRRGEALSLSGTNETLNSKLSDLRNKLSQSNGETHELERVIIEKDKQIQSLNENHQHTRDSLVHYRDSVKEQREQANRQHEHQVQQLQLEFRQVNQTLIVKQGEITELNKDNSRLVSELNNVQREVSTLSSEKVRTVKELNESRANQAIMKERVKASGMDIKNLKNKCKLLVLSNEEIKNEIRETENNVLKLSAQLEIKTELLCQFTPKKHSV